MIADLPRTRSLTIQILFLLSLALLPLGAIAVWQTQRLSVQAERQLQTALLLETERVSGETRLLAERGFGAVQALAAIGDDLLSDPDGCVAILSAFARTSDAFDLVQLNAPDGASLCTNDPAIDPLPSRRASMDGQDPTRPSLHIARSASPGGGYDLVISRPIAGADGAVAGELFGRTSDANLSAASLPDATRQPYGLVTFDATGEILTSTFADGDTENELPAQLDLRSLIDQPAQVFRGTTATGEERAYAAVPLLPGLAYVLTIWPQDALSDTRIDRLAADAFLPLLMWVATLLVAFIALERLVIRHIRVLSRQMRTFARTRRLVSQPVLKTAGSELYEIEIDFRDMAQSILQDEAQLEDNLREKNVLLKEVHHRVKNNLQLITSIMNMQIRRVESEEARNILRRLHERIMGLALVHRALYQAPEINRIDAADLVVDLGTKLVDAANARGRFKLRPRVSPVPLVPEQAVPLSLLVTEALTNAIEHATAGSDGVVDILLSFEAVDDTARLVIESGAEAMPETKATGSAPERGLGHQLIRAFETQLGGKLTMGAQDGTYRVEIGFPVRSQNTEARDY